MSNSKQRSEFVKWDLGHMADGLFVPMRGRSYKKLKTDTRHELSGHELHFMGFEPLGGVEQSMLMSVAAQTSMNAMLIAPDTTGPNSRQLFLDLQGSGDAARSSVGYAHTSRYRLLVDAGIDPEDTKNLARCHEALKRLANVQLAISDIRGSKPRLLGQQNLFGYQVQSDGSYRCALNWRLTEAVVGDLQHARVSLLERAEIRSEVGKILHAWLSSYIRPGAELTAGRGAGVDRLVEHVWAQPVDDLSRSQLSKRRANIRAALDEIAALDGWRASVSARGVAYVTRPARLPAFYCPSDQADAEESIHGFLYPDR